MINAWTQNGRIVASYRDKGGVLSVRDIGEAEYTAFVRSSETRKIPGVIDRRSDFPGWVKLVFVDYDARKHALELFGDVLFEADVSPVRRFVTDHNVKIDPPSRGYLDIETDSGVSFSEAILGNTTLLSFAIVDEKGNKY